MSRHLPILSERESELHNAKSEKKSDPHALVRNGGWAGWARRNENGASDRSMRDEESGEGSGKVKTNSAVVQEGYRAEEGEGNGVKSIKGNRKRPSAAGVNTPTSATGASKFPIRKVKSCRAGTKVARGCQNLSLSSSVGGGHDS